MDKPQQWRERLAEERWQKEKKRKKAQQILLSHALEFYDCAYCAQSYAIMPTKCIKCNHYSFDFISIRICFI